MRIRNCLPIFLALFLLSPLAQSGETQTIQGAILLPEHKFGDPKDKLPVVRCGREVEFKWEFHITDFLDRSVISANAYIDNKTSRKVRAAYHVAFFDTNSALVAAAYGAVDLEPQRSTNFISALPEGDKARLKSVTSYKIVTYVLPPETKK